MKQLPTDKNNIWSCRFFWAAVLVLFANLAFAIANPFSQANAVNLPSQHTWEWWRSRQYVSEKQAPDVVLLGSSLVMDPLAILDADYLNKPIDAAKHYQSRYMEDALAKNFQISNPSCINFGLPGSMASDDYMVARSLFTENRKPKVIVVGLSLRDFIEGHVMYAATTRTFKHFQHFFDVADLVSIAMPEWWQRYEYYFGKSFPLSGQRLELQLAMNETVRSAIQPLLSTTIMPDPLAEHATGNTLAAKLKSVIEEGDYVIYPNCPLPFDDNTKEYKSRFRSRNQALFRDENIFLDKLLTFANTQGIKVIVANMPLTPANMALMPPGSYDEYMQELQRAVQKHNCAYIDFNGNSNQFSMSDFRDTAHMNGSGGRKFIDVIVNKMHSDPALAAALTGAAPSVAAKRSPTSM